MDDGQPGGEGIGIGGFQMMGIMNAFKTGDMQTDMIIAMCIPFIMRFIFRIVNSTEPATFLQLFFGWWKVESDLHHRYVTYKCTRTTWGSTYGMDNDSKNSILMKAIRLYIDQVLKLRLDQADVVLTGTQSPDAGYHNSYYESDDDSDGGSRRTMVGMLSRYKIMQSPPNNEWHSLGYFRAKDSDEDVDETMGGFRKHGKQVYDGTISNGKNDENMEDEDNPRLGEVELRIETETETDGDSGNNNNNNNGGNNQRPDVETTRFHFTSPKEGAIDAFIETAYKWYLDQLRKMEDNARYFYELKVSTPKITSAESHGEDSSDSEGAVYKRYKLSDQKTFQSLFFRQKESLLSLIDHFTNRTGKYAIPGYPHKLGVMLHGPPGTGKTSLIKALAHYTGRSIINVPLSKVSTNAELMSIFFDNKYQVEGGDVAVTLNFKDVIFVMEDVDAASKVVRRRDGMKTADVVQTETVEMPLPKSMWTMLLESTDSNCRELVEVLMEKSERLKKEAEKPEVIRAIAQRMMGLPGLGLVGETGDDKTLSKISKEAVDAASDLMNQYSTVNQFVSTHAEAIKALVDSGTEVDDSFVDDLLGLTTGGPISMISPLKPGALSRNVSYNTYSENEEVTLGGGTPPGRGKANGASMGQIAQKLFQSQTSAAAAAGNSTNGSGMADGLGLDMDIGGGSGFGTSSLIGPSLGFGKKNKDALSLAGLLNVLDGVVDSPSRMLIMTTNHPEMLDPALVRPGRIDKKIMLGYMQAEDVVHMLQHYFQTELTQEHRETVEGIFRSEECQLQLTPAQVEQMTAEHETVEEMIGALADMAQPTEHKKKFCKTSATTLKYNV